MMQEIGEGVVQFLRFAVGINLLRRQQRHVPKPLFFCQERGDVTTIDDDVRVHEKQQFARGLSRAEIVAEREAAVARVGYKANLRES